MIGDWHHRTPVSMRVSMRVSIRRWVTMGADGGTNIDCNDIGVPRRKVAHRGWLRTPAYARLMMSSSIRSD